jgi:hypothetical protein
MIFLQHLDITITVFCFERIMRTQYKYVCPNCYKEGYVCRQWLDDHSGLKESFFKECRYCGTNLHLTFNLEKKKFDVGYSNDHDKQ